MTDAVQVMPMATAQKERGGGFRRRTMAMLVKEFIQLKRDRVSFAMIVMIPLIQLLLFGYAINTTPRDLPTAVLLQESSDVGRSIIAALEAAIAPNRHQSGLTWVRAEASLEDVFIDLLAQAQDNFQ